MAYTEKEVLAAIELALAKGGLLYKSACLNWTGVTKDTRRPYSEVIAEHLLDVGYPDCLARLKSLGRSSDPTPTGKRKSSAAERRREEALAKRLLGKHLNGIGVVVAEQFALNRRRADAAGKIDLIAFDASTGCARVVELKADGSNETLLRAALEIATYAQLLAPPLLQEKCEARVSCIERVVLIGKGTSKTTAAHEAREAVAGKRPHLARLLRRLGVSVFSVDRNTLRSSELFV